MNNDKKITIVPSPVADVHQATAPIPQWLRQYGFWIISCHSSQTGPDSFLHNHRKRFFEFYSLSHMHSGRGKLWIEDRGETELESGDVVLIAPGICNYYGGFGGESYCEDAICFAGPAADVMLASGIISSGVYNCGPWRKLLPIMELWRDPARSSQIAAAAALQTLLLDLYAAGSRMRRVSPAARLLDEIRSDPHRWWTVQDLCERAARSPSQLRRDFLQLTGMLPKNYIEAFKLRQAAELLRSTTHSVGRVARDCGYLDPYHFSRRFKHFFGVSPEVYRRTPPGERIIP